MKLPLLLFAILLMTDLSRSMPKFLARKRRAASVRVLDVHIRSEGCEDPGKTPNTCGIAYIKVDGVDHSLHQRGHNVVVLDVRTGNLIASKAFDTHGDGAAGTNLASYLESLVGEYIVLVAIQDEGSRYGGPALDALRRKGAKDPILTDFRGSYALAGYAQPNKPSWVSQAQNNRGQGPSEITLQIPLQIPPYETIGCYKDTADRAIPTLEGKDAILDGAYQARINAIKKCYEAAKKRGFKVFAVQDGGWCASSATADKTFDKHGASSACGFDGEGGPGANQVYFIRDYLESFGCFKDTGDRAIPTIEGSDSILDGNYQARQHALSKCAVAALRKGFSMFAVQDGGWCASSDTAENTFDKYGKYTTCGNDGEGGPAGNNVYLIVCQDALGMESRAIPDGQISASSEWDSNHAAIQGRLNYKPSGGKQGAWSAKTNDANQWLQVDLGASYTKVTRVASQGRLGADQWVKTYRLQYSNDGVNFQDYREQGQTVNKEILANVDRDTVISHELHPPIWARYIRVRPMTWHNHISMRVEVYGCRQDNCFNNPVGVANVNVITDDKMKASSIYGSGYQAAYGRLHGTRGDGWCAKDAARNDDWLQVEFGKTIQVCGAATQGDRNGNEWVKAFKLSYSSHGSNWVPYKDGRGVEVEFLRKGDSNTVDQHLFPLPVPTRFIRFNPTQRNNWNCLRVEVYGKENCQYALGMQTGAILNGQVSASSEWDWNLAAHFGRLHYIPPIGNTGSWSARTNDANQWLQVNLRIHSRVTRVASQGRHSVSQWVTKYNLQYGDDGTNFQYYIEEGGTAAKEFDGNTDSDTVVYHPLRPSIKARYIRFRPVTWYSHISMRVEVYGCHLDINECTPSPCQNGGTCVDLVGSYRCDCQSGYTGANCETDINECSPDPCQNGATCVDLVGSYRCDCKSGYTGSNCETDINECSPNACQNGATCVDLVGSYRCDCKSGYTGNNCETDINDCAPAPCQNGATCVDLVGSYRCDCKSGYTGNNCETDINECSPNPCQNEATCVDLVGSYRCDCKSGYTGSNCETNIDECAPAPCKNGGTCVDLVGSYRCDCAPGFFGVTCEESEVDDCVQ